MAGEQEDVRDSHGAEGILVAGRYRLVERLGAGGMGRVWKAHDEALDCQVAIKEVWLPPTLTDAERADRLVRAQREARNAARMRDHPHIVSVHDMVSDQGMPWIVMDLVPSRDLMQTVDQFGPLPQDQIVKIGLSVLDALTASHAAGILHRDVKPANVLLTTDGRVLLTDFGIAVQESDRAMTANGVVVGSPEFVAPERARGGPCDGASDLFSLGATLYYAAEGRSAFARDTAVAVLTAILFDQTTPLMRQPELAPLISGLLTKDPAARWSADRARAELERLQGTAFLGTVSAPVTLAATAAPAAPVTLAALAPQPQAPQSARPPQSTQSAQLPQLPQPQASQLPQPPTMAAVAVSSTSPAGAVGSIGGGGGATAAPAGTPTGKNTGRNVGIGVGALLVVAGIVTALALHTGKKNDAGSPVGDTSSHSATSQAPDSSSMSATPATASTTDPRSATWDSSTADQTPFTPDALLPVAFTDSKGVVYTATNRWTDNCVNPSESARLKAMLTQYQCEKRVIGTYVDSTGRIMIDVSVLPLPDAKTATTAFQDMQDKKAFTVEDWGIWCPKSGPGSDICGAKKNPGGAQQYGYIQPDHRYLVHAVSLYVNLSADASAQAWLVPAATGAAKQSGPQVAVQ